MHRFDYNREEIRKQFKELFECSLDFIYVHDFKGNFLDANDFTLEILGYNSEEISNLSFNDLIDKNQMEKAINAIKEIKENGKQLQRTKYKIKTKSGDYIYVETYGIPLKKNGRIYAILGVASNITMRKKAEEELKKNHVNLEFLIKEKTKELNCLYNLSKIADERNITLDELMKKSVEIIPHAYQYPEITCARLFFYDHEYKTSNFVETNWNQTSNIIVSNDKVGHIDVYYTEEKPLMDEGPFMNSERDLINAIAERLGKTIEHYNLKEAHLKNETRYRDLYEEAPIAYFSVGSDNTIKECNKAAVHLLGYSAEELLNMKMNELYADTPNGISKATKIFQRFLNGDTIRDEELQMKHKDGNLFWIGLTVKAIYDVNGNITASRSMVNDITERKKSEKKLKESEEKYRLITENASDMITVENDRLEIEYINESTFSKFLGYSNDDLIGNTTYEFIHPEDRKKTAITTSKILRRKKGSHELRFKHKNGEYRWLEITAKNFINNKGERKILTIFRDITDKKKTEQKLKDSEKKYRAILENINEGYFESDLKGNFTFINDALCEIQGYSKEEFLGSNYSRYVDDETKEKISKEFNEVYRTGKEDTIINFEVMKKNEEKTYIESSLYLRYDSQGNKIGFNGIIRDITKQKRAEFLEQRFKEQLENDIVLRTKELTIALEQQKRFLKELIKTSQIKNEFLATMSHELRTPLNSIIGFTDLLIEESFGPLNEEQMQFLNDIKTSAEHQFNMVKEILEISEIESGQTPFNIKPISLNLMINQILSTMKSLCSNKDIKFKIKGLNKEKEIFADANKFKEILNNLLSNAIKYTIEGQITFIFKEEKQNWIFSVKDTGIGIDQKDFDLVFKEFKRIDSAYVNSVPGTGLGLSLTKMLVNLHGGNISFISKLGKGSNFTFTIPKSLAKRASIKPEDFLNII